MRDEGEANLPFPYYMEKPRRSTSNPLLLFKINQFPVYYYLREPIFRSTNSRGKGELRSPSIQGEPPYLLEKVKGQQSF